MSETKKSQDPGVAREPVPRESQPAEGREVAFVRASIDGLSREVERPDFVGGATSTIRNEQGEVEAMACAAVGWRAAWLVSVMQLLNDAVVRAVGDARARSLEVVKRAAVEAARRSDGGEA